MTEYVRYHSGEWSALYENGKLVKVGDHYLSDEYLAEKLGVEEIYDNDDFLTPDQRGALPTLEAVQTVTRNRVIVHEEAESLRQQAKHLLEMADIMEGKND